jgi:hypothetical protein
MKQIEDLSLSRRRNEKRNKRANTGSSSMYCSGSRVVCVFLKFAFVIFP